MALTGLSLQVLHYISPSMEQHFLKITQRVLLSMCFWNSFASLCIFKFIMKIHFCIVDGDFLGIRDSSARNFRNTSKLSTVNKLVDNCCSINRTFSFVINRMSSVFCWRYSVHCDMLGREWAVRGYEISFVRPSVIAMSQKCSVIKSNFKISSKFFLSFVQTI